MVQVLKASRIMALLWSTADSSDIECTRVEHPQPSDVPRPKVSS